jgi:hypothetical protein
LIRFVSVVLVVFVSACQTAYKDGQPNEDSPRYKVPVDSTLILHQDLTIPAKTAIVYLQRGEVFLKHYQVNRYFTYCELEVSPTTTVPWTVKADEFVISKVTQKTLFGRAGFIQLASRGLGFGKVASDDDNKSGGYEVIATRMTLRSERQAAVQALVCANWGPAEAVSYLTIRGIQNALGDIFTLRLAQSP